MFISFEGIEGVGKSTQLRRLEAYMTSKGFDILSTLEPGGTPIGKALRNLILDTESDFKAPYTEVLLFYADRMEHVAHVLKPALEAGKIVLCDRYIDSTIAYQQAARQVPEELINQLNSWIGVMPNLTILFDIEPEISLERAKKRADLDRFEQESLDFHHRVRNGYLDQAKKNPERIKIIQVNDMNEEQVFEALITTILARIKQTQ
jgi:dTMP kinase